MGMESELKKYQKYRAKLKFMLMCLGLWLDHETQPKLVGIFLSLCSATASCAIFYSISAFCFKYAADINQLTRGFGFLISFISIPLKIFIIRHHRDDIRALNAGVSRLFKEDLEIPENRPHLLAHLGIFTKFFYTFRYSVGLTAISYALIPLSFVPRGKYLRMYPQVLPFAYVPGGLIHWCVYGFEIFVSFFLWSGTCGFDSLFGYYTLHLVGELKLLTSRFQALKSCSSYKDLLRKCVKRHVVLTETHHLLERSFGFSAVWLAVTCAIVLCALMFQASQMKQISVLKVCFVMCYVLLKMSQAFFYAWYGNIIKVESEACLEAMYDAHWPGSGNKHFMKDVLIVLSQKPFIFHAKSIMVLGLDMFVKIANATVSYFFLLRTLSETLG